MQNFKVITLLIFMGYISIALASSAYAKEFASNCDLAGTNLKAIKKTEKANCLKHCLDNKNCRGAVFISHWNQCFLKKSIKRKVELALISAEKSGPLKADQDYSGKDYKQTSQKTAQQCLDQCKTEAQCQAITYMQGYQTCWLKKTKGNFRSKVFYCFQK